MTTCEICGHDQAEGVSCLTDRHLVFPNGAVLLAMPFFEEAGFCSECNAASGGTHHDGCSRETCPKCLGQWATCPCEAIAP